MLAPHPSENQWLATAETYFQEQIAPQATLIDQDSQVLKQALKSMGDRQLLGLKGLSHVCEITFRRFQMMIARYSGALAFVQLQHQGAVAKVADSDNQALKQAYLPSMITGERLVGVGFSQLRRLGEPLMKAIRVKGGYQLSGEVPWITGWGIFYEFIIGARLPTGEDLYGIIPFESAKGLEFSPIMELAAMGTANTVNATVQDWFLPSDRLVALQPSGQFQEQDRQTVLHHGFLALGCAQAGLDILQDVYEDKRLPFLKGAFEILQEELNNCTQRMVEGLTEDVPFGKKLQLRAWAINLAGRCSQAAVTASSGTANLASHPAQRVYREALVFTVLGQTTAVMEATLEQLCSGFIPNPVKLLSLI